MSDYRTCTPEEALELSRAIEHDLRERVRELSAENDRLLDINADLYEALVAARNEIESFPKSMGYDITTLPVIDAAIAKARGEEPQRD
jgi:hypothetical protein